MNITLTFTLDETKALLTVLKQLPYNQSASLIQAIRSQAISQIPAANTENVMPEVVNG